MTPGFVKVRRHILNVEQVADGHWEGEVLYVHLAGGGFAQLRGKEAALIWQVLETLSLDLETGQVDAVKGKAPVV